MVFKVFVSHANHVDDLPLIERFAGLLRVFGFTPLLAKEAYEPTWVKKKIETMIDEADAVIVIHTMHAKKSSFVQQEIGYAHKAAKIFFIVQEGKAKVEGFVYGYDTINLDSSNIDSEIRKLEKALLDAKAQKDFLELLKAGVTLAIGLGFVFLLFGGKQ